MVTFDNVIFSLQSHGGISVFWRELMDGIKTEFPYTSIDYTPYLKHERNRSSFYSIIKVLNPKAVKAGLLLPRKVKTNIFHSSFVSLLIKLIVN